MEFEIKGVEYRAAKLTVFEQLNLGNFLPETPTSVTQGQQPA